jgi:hypothetical protein
MINKKNILLYNIIFRLIKLTAIAYITVLFFIVGYFFGRFIDYFCSYLFGLNFNEKKNYILVLEILFQIMLIAMFAYFGRNIVQLIPFPLDGVLGFIHLNLKELNAVGFINVFIYSFQYYMQDKLDYIKKKQEKYFIYSSSNSNQS